MPLRTVLTAAAITMMSTGAFAQGSGFTGSTVGLTASGVPSNPFASNYPSAPPPRATAERRERRAVDRRSGEPLLLPPGRIPR